MYSFKLNRRMSLYDYGFRDKLDYPHIHSILHRIPIQWVDVYEDGNFKIPRNKFTFHSHYLYHDLTQNVRLHDENSVHLLRWCIENCKGKFGFKYSDIWYFEKKEECIWFGLTWHDSQNI